MLAMYLFVPIAARPRGLSAVACAAIGGAGKCWGLSTIRGSRARGCPWGAALALAAAPARRPPARAAPARGHSSLP